LAALLLGKPQIGAITMAFPPNYNQERNNRAKAKQAKAVDKANKRDEKNAQRKQETEREAPQDKDNS
jgi:hypothetical protein